MRSRTYCTQSATGELGQLAMAVNKHIGEAIKLLTAFQKKHQ
jgi:hypothetical protein